MKLTKMQKTNSDAAQRAWSLLRLALVWTRKGGVFKRRLMMELRLVPKFFKGLGHSAVTHRRLDQISYYKERELSFDETPLFQVKMHRPASMRFLLPCISPEEVDFDYDFGLGDDQFDGVYGSNGESRGRKSYSSTSSEEEEEEEEEEQGEDKDCGYEGCDEKERSPISATAYPLEEEGIDSKAEKFIANFYAEMKLQRQISYLEYTEMLNRGAS